MKWTQALLMACCFSTLGLSGVASAQVTDTSATVTSDSSTWVVPTTGNAVTLSAGVNGLTITNEEGGRIVSSDATGIENAGNNTIDNAGLIDGAVNGVDFVNGLGSGLLTNQLTGVIQSDSRAVNIGGEVELINLGSLLGTGDQRNGTVYSDSVANNFSIDNSGLIDAGVGNQGAGVALEIGSVTTATITNSGVIQGRTNTPGVSSASGLSGDGLRLANFGSPAERVFDGSITNTADGRISSESNSGTTAGVRFANTIGFQGTLDNAGLIEGVRNGLYFGNPVNGLGGDHTGGVVNNSGRIESASRALNLDGIGLVVNNSGDILGTGDQRNGTVYADSTAQGFSLNNLAGGLIDAGAGNLGAGFSAELSEAGNDYDIVNAGQIVGRGNAGAGLATAGDGIRFERTRVDGALDGSTTGLFTGSISNSGSITSEGANGTVAAIRFVNGTSFQGELNNDGVIAGVQNGLYFGNPVPAGGGDHTGGVVNNQGIISSDSRALNLDGIGVVVNNSGSLLGTGDQRNGTVYADSTAQGFTLNNSGLIDAGEDNLGAGFSAELSAAGNDYTITNSGDIVGRGDAGAGLATAGDGIRLERSRLDGSLGTPEVPNPSTGLFTGTINNSGTITSEGANGTVGGFRAVNGVSFQGVLNNSGTIAGVQNGVYFGNPTPAGGGDHTGGVVNNTGVISSDSRAFNLDGVGLTVNNFGDILATGRQRNGTLYVDGTADLFTVNNAGSIDARGGAGSGLSIQVGSFAGDVQTATLINTGSIIGAGDQPVDAGVRLFSNTPNTTFVGDIENRLGGLIASEGKVPAVLVEDGVNFDGALLNDGTIDGGVSLATGNAVLSDTSLVILDIAGLGEGEFETFDVGGDLTLGGTLQLVFHDGFVPGLGDTFDLFDFGSVSGGFDQIVSNGGVLFDTSNLLVDGSLSISAVGVPEPTAFVLLALAGGIVSTGVRRRR